MKVVIGTDKGKSYQIELSEEKAKLLYNLKIGDEFNGDILNMPKYTLIITGGSDKQGFPMRKGVKGSERRKLLLDSGTGVRKLKKGVRLKKSVRGEVVSEEIAQLNVKIIRKGDKDIEELLNLKNSNSEKEGEKSE